MELREAKELLPFYVANTLTPVEKGEVDEALKASKELNDELAFWRKALLAVHAHAEYARKGHLSSEQIVDYAERTVTDQELRSTIEVHLQGCTACRAEYDMIMQTMPRPGGASDASRTFTDTVRQFITSFKPIYALPVAAVLIALVVLWRNFETKDVSSVENSVRFVLPFQPQVRAEYESVPNLAVNESVKQVELVLCIPHDSLAATQYTATLSTPAGKTITLPETLSKVVSPLMDSLKLNLEAASLQVEGEYTLSIAEIPSSLPSGATPFPPEPYRFRVTHTARK